jgi:serine/threonine protein kinase
MDHGPDIQIGQILDNKYRIEALIGVGGMGTVYRVLHLQLKALRAIKVLRPELAADERFATRFRNEAMLAESLRHPNVVTVYDMSPLDSGAFYIVWEYVKGETLAQIQSRGVRYSPLELVEIMCPLADGLLAVHRKGILHRDISPDNIVLTEHEERPYAKLLDFGLAKLAEESRSYESGDFLGKVGYASPEQIGLLAETEEIDERTDVFSLAVVAYAMLVGRLPFRVSSPRAYFQDVVLRSEEAVREDFACTLTERWRGFFARALARDRNERLPSMAAFKSEIQSAAADSPEALVSGEPDSSLVATTNARPAYHLKAWRNARPTRPTQLGAVLLAALTVIFILLAVFMLDWSHSETPLDNERALASSEPTSGKSGTTPIPVPRGNEAVRVRPKLPPPEKRAEPSPAESQLPTEVSGESEDEDAAAPVNSSPKEPTSIQADKHPSPATGVLSISSSPSASVFIDETPVGVTPLRLDIEPGEHRLLLITSDGRRLNEIVIIRSNESFQLHRDLTGFGSLAVTSDVWVEVSLDGGPPEQTPTFYRSVSAGTHQLAASRVGYITQTLSLLVRRDETTTVQLEMEKNQRDER